MQGSPPRMNRAAYALARRFLLVNKALLFTVILAIVLSLESPIFFSWANATNLMEQVAVLTIVAVAVTLVLGAGEIDLSVGAIVGLTGAVMAKLMWENGLPWEAAIPVGILVGIACGLVNASLISTIRIPPFIVTLATASLYTGILYIITNLVPVSVPIDFQFFGQGFIGPVPASFCVVVPATAVIYLLATRSVFGLHVVALGGNPEAVRLAGISTTRLRLALYGLVGAYCGVAGVILTAWSASAQVSAGSDLMLLVIAAVVIGGTPLSGGKTNVFGTFFGCVVIGMINNGLVLLGVNPNFQIIFQGMLILAALVVDVQSTRLLAALTQRERIAAAAREAAFAEAPTEA
jgi:ribose/xylose/arabinose/galactoside ABC-type transport system permease subunit